VVDGQLHTPVALPSGERPGTHFTRGSVGPKARLDGCGKSRPHQDSIPEPSTLFPLGYPGRRGVQPKAEHDDDCIDDGGNKNQSLGSKR
jgi:hypothetical protein